MPDGLVPDAETPLPDVAAPADAAAPAPEVPLPAAEKGDPAASEPVARRAWRTGGQRRAVQPRRAAAARRAG